MKQSENQAENRWEFPQSLRSFGMTGIDQEKEEGRGAPMIDFYCAPRPSLIIK